MKLINFIISHFNDSNDKTKIRQQTKEMQNQLKVGLTLAHRTDCTKDVRFQTVSAAFISLCLQSFVFSFLHLSIYCQ